MSSQAGPRSMRQLLEAVVSIGTDLDLHAMLQRVVAAAVDLVDARYGALGVLDDRGEQLADFITVGIDDSLRAEIGHLPRGRGILGLLITDARPLRLADLREHPASVGFPAHHPPMHSFLGVPISVRGRVFGNLYLTDKTTAEVFTDIDEELVIGLASAAGVAIENARLYEEQIRREAVLRAIQEVATSLAGPEDTTNTLRLVASRARTLAAADLASIALPLGTDSMVIAVADGLGADELAGVNFPRAGSVSGDVLNTNEPVQLADATADDRHSQPLVGAGRFGPAIFIPLYADGRAYGTLSLARTHDRPPFTIDDLETLSSFAAQASLVIQREQDRQALHRIDLLEDQERIGRDLHDTVIQRLFGTGLSLQGALRLTNDAEVQRRLGAAVDDLDLTVREIRTVIFDLQGSVRGGSGVRSRVLDLAREASRPLGFEPRVLFEGPIDTAVSDDVATELLATLREALSNVARHANAGSAVVDLHVDGTHLVARVRDDGRGLPGDADPAGRGMSNMRTRAERLGGTFDVRPSSNGTVVEWRVPLSR